MKIYEAKIKEGEQHFTTAIVKNPAVEEKLIYFNEEKPLFFANEEKRVIYAVAMRPKKLIDRNDINGEPAKVFFTEESIEKFQQMYAKNLGQKLTNINHTDNYISDVYPIENWIVKDPEMDKSKAIGLPVIKGDLVMGFKVENDQVWEDCKAGKLDGLSIESYLDYIEINKKEEMKKQTIWEAFKSMLKVFADENNTMTISVDGKDWNVTALAVDGVVTDSDGNPLSDGSFEYEGNKYETNEMGVIKEVSEVEVEMTEEEKPKEEETPKEEEMADEVIDQEKEDLKTKIAELETKLADIEAKKIEAETELEKMKKQTPKAQFVSMMPKQTQKPYDQMTNKEKALFNRGKL